MQDQIISSSLEVSGSVLAPSFTGSFFSDPNIIDFVGTASWAMYTVNGATPNLQAVTTAGNHTSESIYITGSLTNGDSVLAIGLYSHAQGEFTQAIGQSSHAEGLGTEAYGPYSHTEGQSTKTYATGAYAAGVETNASGPFQHVLGQYNLPLQDTAALIIGDGTNPAARHNVLYAGNSKVEVTGSLKVTGSSEVIGAIYIGGANTNGSFRMRLSSSLSGPNLVVEKLIAGIWTYSGNFS